MYLEILLCTVNVHSLTQVYRIDRLKSRVIDFSLLRGDFSKTIQRIFVTEWLKINLTIYNSGQKEKSPQIRTKLNAYPEYIT